MRRHPRSKETLPACGWRETFRSQIRLVRWFAGKLKHPKLSAAARGILDLRHQRRPGDGVRAAVADYYRDILFAVDAISNGAGARDVVQAGFPQHLAVRIVVSANIAVERPVEHDAARGCQCARGLWCALPIRPDHFARFQINGFKAAILAVAIQTRPDSDADAGR